MHRLPTVPWVLTVATLVVAFFPLLLGQFYVAGDMRDVFIPLEDFFRQQTLSGALPTWNPNVAWGFPVLASAQIGFFYPPLLVARLLPIWLYLPLIFVGSVVATIAGTYLFLRALGMTRPASTLGAISFGLSAFVVQHFTHLNITLAVPWLPWQLLTVHWLTRQPRPANQTIVLLALVCGTPFLLGQMHIPTLCAMVTSMYFLTRSKSQQNQILKPFILLLVAGLAGVGLAAAQLLPTSELLTLSSRGAAGDFDVSRANQHSYPLYHLPTLLFPRFFGTDMTYWGKRLEIEYGFFIGTLPLLLAVWVSITRWRTWRAWVLTTLVTLLLALGDLSPFRLIGLEPSLWFFSAPARWLLITTFSLSVLAAAGFDALPVAYQSFRKFLKIIAVVVAFMIVSINAIYFTQPELLHQTLRQVVAQVPAEKLQRPAAYYEEKINQLVSSMRTSTVSLTSVYTLLSVTVFTAAVLAPARRFQTTIVLVTLCELALVALTSNPTKPWHSLLAPPETISQLPDSVRAGQARLVTMRATSDTGALLTNPASRTDRDQQRKLLVPLLNAQFNLPGVEWPASLDLPHHTAALDEIRDPGSYAFNVDRASEYNVGALMAASSLPVSGSFLAKRELDEVSIYDVPVTPRATLVGEDNKPLPAVIQYLAESPTRATITSSSDVAGTLVVRDTWYPGWEATVDGRPAVIEQYPPFFKSVDVPAGEHKIELTFRSQSVRRGLIVSLVTAAVLCVVWFAHRFAAK